MNVSLLKCVERSIPACAGEPMDRNGKRRLMVVYPRVCGGTTPPALQESECSGLSPRVRGNRLAMRSSKFFQRSIPACAGEPSNSMPAGSDSTVYPRVCGEPGRGSAGRYLQVVYPRVCGGTTDVTAVTAGDTGLSPRVRGNQSSLIRHGTSRGSIPACAGEP